MTVRRVLFPFAGDDGVGGSHISAMELVLGLDRIRFHPIVAVHKEGDLHPWLEGLGLVAERAPDWTASPFTGNRAWDVGAALYLLPRLILFLRRLRIDLVHTQDPSMHSIWGPAAKLAGSGFILHLRSAKMSGSRIGFSSKWADSIIAISDYTVGCYPSGIRKKMQVILNPVRPLPRAEDRELCRDELLGAMKINPRIPIRIIGFVSNFMSRKRPETFVEIASRLRDRLGDHVFFPMFGEMDGRNESSVGTRGKIKNQVIKKITEYGLASRCILMGPRYPIEHWMKGFDVLVAPAVGEPFGRTLVEAMLCGTPVVAADDGGHREIIRHGETGLLVPTDAAAFADAVAGLLDHPRMASAIAAAAKADALKRYSVETHVERIQRIYDSVL